MQSNHQSIFVDNKVANKQHASRLAVEQPTDLVKAFLLIKAIISSYLVKNILADKCQIKVLMIDAFKEQLNDDLIPPPNKIISLIHFISTISEMATKAYSVKNMQHGFIKAGLIDGVKMHALVFDTILSTCCQNLKREEYENIEKNMANIPFQSCDYGHMGEDVYNQMNIVQDCDRLDC
jgi:hypothetical protein